MRSRIALVSTLPLLALTVACGSDGDSTSDDPTADVTAPDESGETEAAADTTEGDAAADESDADDSDSDEGTDSGDADQPVASGGGTATLTLDNGETFEFDSLLCALEPQMSAGSEILFTAVSYGDPGLDITQFGDTGTITDVASISVYDSSYETLWDANSMFGTPVDLSLDGSTITGSGSFLEAGDIANDPVDGTVVANC